MKLEILIAEQVVHILNEYGAIQKTYPVSTAANGVGENNGSFCTPRGQHIVRAKIGAGCKENTVFSARRQTGEIYTSLLGTQFPDRDWILTRIFWLSGCSLGFNRLGNVDTMRRYVYIHGTPESTEISKPGSKGCIRMKNKDIIELFEQVPVYTRVDIVA